MTSLGEKVFVAFWAAAASLLWALVFDAWVYYGAGVGMVVAIMLGTPIFAIYAVALDVWLAGER